ncbi:MAG: hypothetical protein DCC68_18345 [Planctomycetota bacterium]|nr:MAG: hypothetical protein DCC68_18345 [Planctomycetota bacterium]
MVIGLATHIESRSDVCGGKPCIAGTRIRVQDVYAWHELRGQSPEEIVADFPQLTLGQVYAALAYSHDHRDEILAAVAEERTWAEQMKAGHPSKLLAKVSGKDVDDSISP